MPTFYGTIAGHRIQYPDQMQYESLMRWLSTLKDGSHVSVKIAKQTSPRTNKQLAALFGLALARIKQAYDDSGWDTSYIFKIDHPTGVEVTVEQLKEYFYSLYPMTDNGKRVTLSTCSKEQASYFFEAIRNHVAPWGIEIPDPDPNWRSKVTNE